MFYFVKQYMGDCRPIEFTPEKTGGNDNKGQEEYGFPDKLGEGYKISDQKLILWKALSRIKGVNMEVKLLLAGIALAIWAVLMRHLSKKFTFPLSMALFPLGIISVMICVLIKNRAFTAILLVFALAVIIYSLTTGCKLRSSQ